MAKIPTSDLDTFKSQVSKPNQEFVGSEIEQTHKPKEIKYKKHIILSFLSDYSGCGHIRNILPSTYLNAMYGRDQCQIITTPVMLLGDEILRHTRTLYFQRSMGPASHGHLREYKKLQAKYGYKMVYDIDDFVWDGDAEGEEIPEYNFGKTAIDDGNIGESAISNMKLMDTVCVSTEFLGKCIADRGVDPKKIKVVHNTTPNFLWHQPHRKPITQDIKKPTVVWTASPTHWHNDNKLLGDMDNAWREWVIRSVKANKINYIQMGGVPWFFKEIEKCKNFKAYGWVNSLVYPNTVKSFNADIGIAPIVPNYFNYSKSAIKYQEYCAVGAVGIGTVFDNKMPSPYDICKTTASDSITADEIDKLVFDHICKKDVFNGIIRDQYKQMVDEHWITESSGYLNMFTKII